jgi:hypothetical protein
MIDRGRIAQLWGGPEDGETLWVPPGDLPRLVGVHRTYAGVLVPIRGRGVLERNLEHVCVYEHVTPQLFRAWCAVLGRDDSHWEQVSPEEPLYVHRDLATRWLTQEQK